MSERMNLIIQIEAGFNALIEATEQIASNVNQAETPEGLGLIVECLKNRGEIMRKIDVLQQQLKGAPEAGEEAQEFEKHRWLCHELAKKLQVTDQANMSVLNLVMNRYMDNIRSTKQSIRAVSAYNMQGTRL